MSLRNHSRFVCCISFQSPPLRFLIISVFREFLPTAQRYPPARTSMTISSRGRWGGPNITWPMRASYAPRWQGHLRHRLGAWKSTEHPSKSSPTKARKPTLLSVLSQATCRHDIDVTLVHLLLSEEWDGSNYGKNQDWDELDSIPTLFWSCCDGGISNPQLDQGDSLVSNRHRFPDRR